MRKVTWRCNLSLNKRGNPFNVELNNLDPGSGAYLGAGPTLACEITVMNTTEFSANVTKQLKLGINFFILKIIVLISKNG